MLKWIYWWITLGFLFILPGLSIIMAILYGCYAIVRLLCSPMTIQPQQQAPVQSPSYPSGEPPSTELAPPALDKEAAREKAAEYAQQMRELELERQMHKDEQELLAKNASHHSEAVASSYTSQADSYSLQDRLEAEARG